MSKTVEVLLSRRVTIGIGEAAGDHEAGTKVTVSEDIASSIVGQGAGAVVVTEKPSKNPTAAEVKAIAEAEAKEKAEKEAADKAAADAATAAAAASQA